MLTKAEGESKRHDSIAKGRHIFFAIHLLKHIYISVCDTVQHFLDYTLHPSYHSKYGLVLGGHNTNSTASPSSSAFAIRFATTAIMSYAQQDASQDSYASASDKRST